MVAMAVLVATAACAPGGYDSAAAGDDEVYSRRPASRDGIGKIYLGREISHVMGHRGADWLERSGREQEERTDLLLDNLPLQPDSVVADIGAGTGYFSFPLAARVPQGKVLAVDIQPQMLELIRRKAEALGVSNIERVLGSERDPKLPASAVDLILLVDAYHEFSYPLEMGRAMARALRPGGRLVLIEYRGEDEALMIKPLHKMTEAQARLEMSAIGLTWERTEAFLPSQHFMVFRKDGADGS